MSTNPGVIDYANLSDEDFLKQPPPEVFEEEVPPVVNTDQAASVQQGTPSVSEDVPVAETDAGITTEVQQEVESELDQPTPVVGNNNPMGNVVTDPAPVTDLEGTNEQGNKPVEEEQPTDAQGMSVESKAAAFDLISQPFKASGKTFQVESPQEAIRLMQMGVDYSRKMESIKPYYRFGKILEQHDLMDEQKLMFLVDLHKRNPQAIAKLVSDTGLDTYNLNAEEASKYQVQSTPISEPELAIRTVIDELATSPHYNEMMDVVTAWDKTSKETIGQNPDILRGLHDHVSQGIFQQVMPHVERAIVLGQTGGKPLLRLYSEIADRMFAQPQTQQPVVPAAPQGYGQQSHYPQQQMKQPAKPAVDPAVLAARRKAVSPSPTGTPAAGGVQVIDLSKLSDEEVLNLDINNFAR